MKPEAETTGRCAVPQVQGPPHPLRARVLGWRSEQGGPSGTTSLQCHLTGVIPRLPQGEKAWHQAVSVQHEAPLEGKGASGLRPAPVSDAFLLWLLSVLFPAQPGPRAHGLSRPGPFSLQPVGHPAALLCLGPEPEQAGLSPLPGVL